MKNHKICIIFLIITPLTLSQSASPVYEVINEQARIDEKVRNPGILPYGNPLAGKQNARQHFNNQQAMFNAERIRQLTAQLQRQSRGPKLIDSYMQAYHESQNNHQLALEQQQADLKEQVIPLRQTQKATQRPITKRINKNDQPRASQGVYGTRIQRTEPSKTRPDTIRITKADAKDVKYRNYRSYGSVDFHQYLEPRRYKTVYVSPAPTYDQGVTIKPNGNIGFAQETNQQSKLLTEAIPSDIKYVYPKQYRQMQNYKSVQELQNLNSLLSPQTSQEYTLPSINSDDVPIDFYFYLKDPSHLSQNSDQFRYAQLANSYKGAYNKPVTKEYTPITEEVDDIEDPNAKNPKAYTPLPEPTAYPQPQPTMPTKEENYNIEDVNPSVYTYEEKPEEKPITQAIHYYQPYYIDGKEQNEKYLHHNAETTGVQHLTEDGTGVSAYGDDNVSKNNRNKRSNLETEPFSTGSSEVENTYNTPDNSTEDVPSALPTPEPLIRLLAKKRKNHLYVNSNESDDDDIYIPVKIRKKKHEYEASYEEDYNDYDEGIDFSTSNIKPVIHIEPHVPKFHNTKRNHQYYVPPATSYGYPINYGSPIQSIPTFSSPVKIPSANPFSKLQDILEPVYMITESQLKELMGHNLNIEHLDVFQLSKPNKLKTQPHYPRRYKKRNAHGFRNSRLKSKLHKLEKFLN